MNGEISRDEGWTLAERSLWSSANASLATAMFDPATRYRNRTNDMQLGVYRYGHVLDDVQLWVRLELGEVTNPE